MARQAEYYRDEHAPRPNSLRPKVCAAVRDDYERLLVVRRADTLKWELPGGKVNIGESAVDAVLREVAEESAIRISVRGLSGIYTEPDHVIVYESGEIVQEFAVCFHAMSLSGSPRPDGGETLDAVWVYVGDLDQLAVHPSAWQRIDDAVNHPDQVHIH
jgi:8-oxo-dGTP pyrophosphatase MutT (NUDIX family)